MKNFLLTGISNDVNFQENDSSYFLVFNGGELRIPVSEEAASHAVQAMTEEEEVEDEKTDSGEERGYETQSEYDPDDMTAQEPGEYFAYQGQGDYGDPPSQQEDQDEIDDGVGQF